MTSAPHISVAIPTRNRPEDIQHCLESLAIVVYPQWDILVIDQSDDDRTQTIVESFAGRLSNLSYERLREKGACRARNLGVARTRGEIVALLDDDCVIVQPDWLERAAGALARHPEAAIVFGTVKAAPHNPAEGFIPTQIYRSEPVVRKRLAFQRVWGLTASMFMRRALLQDLIFDVYLGPGAYFNYGGDDIDYSYRVLASGRTIVGTPDAVVEHYGFRDYKSGAGSRVARGYAYSLGAQNMKMVRSGDLGALVLVATHAWGFIVHIKLRNLLLRRGPSNAGVLIMYLRGLIASFELTVDRRRCLYSGVRGRPAGTVAGAPGVSLKP